MSDSGSVKKIADSEWLRTLYVETWKRYEHDDTRAQTRGTIFTAILAAIMAFVGVFSIQVVKIPCPVPRQYEIAPGIVILGLIGLARP